MMQGIDISAYQGNLSQSWFNRAKQVHGIDFVIIRAGFGVTAKQIDERFLEYVDRAHNAGMHIGAYWFYYGYNDAMCDANASAFISVLDAVRGKIDMPVYCDYEYDSDKYISRTGHGVVSREVRTGWVRRFCELLEDAGYYAGVYANPDYFNNYFIKANLIGRFTTWLASWGETMPAGYGSVGIWQYTSRGSIEGVTLDRDKCFTDFPAIIRSKRLNYITADDGQEDAPTDEGEGDKVTCPYCGRVFSG